MALQSTKQAIQTWEKPLDDTIYNPDNDEKEFFKKETGIDEDEQLRQHILAVRRKAYSIHQYPCIRIFGFMMIKLGRNHAYDRLLKLGKEREDAILVDLGCCFGSDCRKAAQDGFPVRNIVAVDLRRTLWDLGHELFKSTPETFPVSFIEGNVLDPSFLDIVPTLPRNTALPIPSIPLSSARTLNDLRGRVSAVFAGSFFHLFNEIEQEKIARALAGILSPLPGSMLLGVHIGKVKKGMWGPTGGNFGVFCHSPESWKILWEEIFGEGNVDVTAILSRDVGGDDYFGTYPGNLNPPLLMVWSVIRK